MAHNKGVFKTSYMFSYLGSSEGEGLSLGLHRSDIVIASLHILQLATAIQGCKSTKTVLERTIDHDWFSASGLPGSTWA